MMTAAEAALAAKDLTFEKVWAMFQETDKHLKELSEDTSRQIKELSKKADLRQEETSKQIKELSRNIGGLSSSLGRWAEEMISANLWEKFKALGFTFTHGGPEKY
ncbi:MAG: hypothetical protein LBD96_11035, partial [Treponema sp.]|nr:hypothetical protein [Treponema sp.]